MRCPQLQFTTIYLDFHLDVHSHGSWFDPKGNSLHMFFPAFQVKAHGVPSGVTVLPGLHQLQSACLYCGAERDNAISGALITYSPLWQHEESSPP